MQDLGDDSLTPRYRGHGCTWHHEASRTPSPSSSGSPGRHAGADEAAGGGPKPLSLPISQGPTLNVEDGMPTWEELAAAVPAIHEQPCTPVSLAEEQTVCEVGQAMWVFCMPEVEAPPVPAPGNWGDLSEPSKLCVASFGSVGHPFTCADYCKYNKKPKGCKDGANCDRCHLCTAKKPAPVLAGRRRRMRRD